MSETTEIVSKVVESLSIFQKIKFNPVISGSETVNDVLFFENHNLFAGCILYVTLGKTYVCQFVRHASAANCDTLIKTNTVDEMVERILAIF